MFDATALHAITDELNATILRGRVQEIVQLDAFAFGFEIYAQHARRYLYVSAHPDDARVHLVAQKLRGSGLAPSPLLLLLRKHTEGAFVDAITQLPHERVLKIQFDHSVEGVSTLVVETMGKYSNLILLDATGDILDAVKRVTPAMSRVRAILPQRAYSPPPPQAKRDPATLAADDVARLLAANADAPLSQTLVKTIAGISPLLAREIAHRVGTSRDAQKIVDTLGALTRAPWSPCVAFDAGEPTAFAPYPLTQFADVRMCDSIGAAIELFFGAPEAYSAAKEPLRAQIAEARDKLARKRDALAQSLPDAAQVERFKTNGEWILAYASQIKPRQSVLRAETENGIVEISLDATLTAVENAQKCFKEYHRLRDAAARVPPLLDAANAEVEYAEQMLNDLDLAENRAELDAAIVAARAAGLLAQVRVKSKLVSSEPRAFQSREGFTILVGKNARQNEEITFRRARAEDMWLHARNVAGAHVVIVRGGREIPEEMIEYAAQLAARYSQARDDSRVEVIVTPRKDVRRVRGGKPGMVTVRDERVVTVKL
ncbi:MAG: NFACT family protein [Chloroflexi bacterium]|nr:NFACT family protein [Chloroflexota bacterium]